MWSILTGFSHRVANLWSLWRRAQQPTPQPFKGLYAGDWGEGGILFVEGWRGRNHQNHVDGGCARMVLHS